MVKRYQPSFNMPEHKYGAYVEYSDFIAAIAALVEIARMQTADAHPQFVMPSVRIARAALDAMGVEWEGK